jgi:2-polyprenyl-3-methyl-5-hydroxy-6-metoxy-1,4-benzoquinol methylase
MAEVAEHDRDEMAIPSYLHGNPLIRWLMWRRYEAIERLARLSPKSSVLEFGCGLGLFLPTLTESGRLVYATDLFPQFAQALAAARKLSVRFVPDVDSVSDQSLDVIVAADVLEHVDNLDTYIQCFHRKLKPDGVAIISGPTENVAYRIGRLVAGFGGKGDYHHRNIDEIRSAFEANQFQTERAVSLPVALLPHLFRVFRFRAVE